MTRPEASPRRRQWLQLGLGVAISAAVIWWTFSDYDWAASWNYMVGADRLWLSLAIILATLSFPLRLPRWRLLLRREDGTAVGWRALWHPIAIGFAANNVLPFRAGEVLRPAAVARLGRVPFATALSSIAVERVLDALVAMGLLSFALTVGGFDPSLTLKEGGDPIAQTASRIGMLGLLGLVVIALAAWQRDATLRLARRLLPSNRIGDAIYHFGERILLGIRALHDPRLAIPIVGWTLLLWLCNAASFYAAFAAFGFEVPFSGALIVQGALIIGIAAPQGPGYFGIFELAIAGTLAALFRIPLEAGLACGLLYHVTTFVPITLLGAWSALTSGFRRHQEVDVPA